MNKKDHHSNSLKNERLKKHPFKVEGEYFDGLTENIMNAVNAEESDLKYSLHLKKSPFSAPNGYFDKLSSNIEGKIAEEVKIVPFYQQVSKRWIAVAASIALLAIVYFSLPKADSITTEWDGISDEAIIEFLESENSLVDDFLVDLDQIDSILDIIYADETDIFVDAALGNPELDYDFEYFEY